jgi:hypothetical protein
MPYYPRHYVNCDCKLPSFTTSDGKKVPAFNGTGTKVQLTAILHAKGTGNRKAHWSIEAHPDNLKPDTYPALLGSSTTDHPVSDGDQLSFGNTIFLPRIGGNIYDVVCSKAGRHEESVRTTLQVWKMLWFTVYYTEDEQKEIAAFLAKKIADTFSKHFINMVHVETIKLDSVGSAAIVADSAKESDDYLRNLGKGGWLTLPRTPYHFAIIIVRKAGALCTLKSKLEIAPDPSTPDPGFVLRTENGTWHIDLPFGGGWQFLLDAHQLEHIGRVRGISKMSFGQTVTDFQARFDDREIVNLKMARYQVKRLSETKISIPLSGPLKRLAEEVDKKRSFGLKLTLQGINVLCAGMSDKNVTVIQTHSFDTRGDFTKLSLKELPKENVLRIALHEIGHTIGLVPGGYPNFYEGCGGIGSHCNHNTKLDKRVRVHNGTGELCVMYHAEVPNKSSEFCPKCVEAIRTRGLTSDTLMATWNILGSKVSGQAKEKT